jgi:superfamily II DNA or RNA helicase
MDLSQAAFGLDMRAASRVYFINPVLNPQVEAQAIGRVRRISQRKAVSVETLVLKDSIDEVILERKKHMTQAEHRRAKSILDVRPIYNWIKNTRIMPMESHTVDMVPLHSPLHIFGRGFGRQLELDDDVIEKESPMKKKQSLEEDRPVTPTRTVLAKRPREAIKISDILSEIEPPPPARRVRFAAD